MDPWQVAQEVFQDKLTLTTKRLHLFDEDEPKLKAQLISIFANALYKEVDNMTNFLNEWLDFLSKIKDGYDLAFRTPTPLIEIALLVLARSNNLSYLKRL